MAMALYGVAVVIGPAFGPTLGGYIVDNFSWQWIFYINLPVGAIALLMVQRFVHEPEDIRLNNLAMAEKQRKHLDWQGIALLTTGVATLQYVLEEGNRNDWFESKVITFSAFVAVVAIAAFIIRELTAEVPAVNISLFKEPVFTSGTLVGAVMFAMLLSLTFLLPVFMQELLGFTAVQAGLALMPRSLVMMVMMPIVGRVYNRISPRVCVAFGVLLFTWSAVLMSHYTLDTTSADVVLVLAIQGVAFACLFIPLTTVALSRIPRHLLADATGLNSLLRQIGGSLGLAGFASLIPRITKHATVSLGAHLTPGRLEVMERFNLLTSSFRARGLDTATAQAAAGRVIGGIVGQQAAVITFDRLFLLSGILFLMVLPLLLLLKSPDHQAPNQAAPMQAPPEPVHVEL
jgi:DHA2 family multidrug resistance protein